MSEYPEAPHGNDRELVEAIISRLPINVEGEGREILKQDIASMLRKRASVTLESDFPPDPVPSGVDNSRVRKSETYSFGDSRIVISTKDDDSVEATLVNITPEFAQELGLGEYYVEMFRMMDNALVHITEPSVVDRITQSLQKERDHSVTLNDILLTLPKN